MFKTRAVKVGGKGGSAEELPRGGTPTDAMHSPYRKGRKTGKHERRSILNAAAFQDHMARLVALPSGALGPVSTSGVERARPRGSRAGRHGAEEEEEEETEAEVVGRGHRLTLAQMRGLVEAPRSKLDEYEWLQAHAESMRVSRPFPPSMRAPRVPGGPGRS